MKEKSYVNAQNFGIMHTQQAGRSKDGGDSRAPSAQVSVKNRSAAKDLYDLPFEFEGQQFLLIVLVAVDLHEERGALVGDAADQGAGVLAERDAGRSAVARFGLSILARRFCKVASALIIRVTNRFISFGGGPPNELS